VAALASLIRVLIVDDDAFVRSALALMLGGQEDIKVVGEAADGAEALAKVREFAPNLVLMDIRMPKMDGLAATRQLQGLAKPPAIVVLTTFNADDYVLAAINAGAAGFLLKDTPPDQVIDSIRKVMDGETILSPSAVHAVVKKVRGVDNLAGRTAKARSKLQTLTEREMDVAEAIGRGLSNAEIASELFLSVPTVKAHISRLFEKLQVTNRVQIAIMVHDASEPT
jgi:DNA-binding NarL/FixJ family response regulator